MMYNQLTEHERYMISKIRRSGLGVAEIARVLERHRISIYREIERNSIQIQELSTYCPSKAQKKRNGRSWVSRRDRQHEAWQVRPG